MATYQEAVDHVMKGGTAWESSTWDTDSLLYCKRGKLWSHCGCSGTDEKYIPDDDELNSNNWELLDKNGDVPAEFEVWQDGMMVAGASGPREDALREALHYANQYASDGSVSIYEITRKLITVL